MSLQEIVLPIEQGALVEVPLYERHPRGKNWLAKIREDPRSPGGLHREFLPHGRGRFYYLIEGLQKGDVVEFGADYYTGSGHKSPKRWYGRVSEITPTALLLQPYPDAGAACQQQEERK